MNGTKNELEESTVGLEGGRQSCSDDGWSDGPALGDNELAANGQKPMSLGTLHHMPLSDLWARVPTVASRRHAIHPPAGISSCLSQGFSFTGGGRKHEPSEEDAEQREGRCH